MIEVRINRPIPLPIELKVKIKRKMEREEFIKVLGGKCTKCEFSDWRALQVDHINGNGPEDRKKYGCSSRKYYRTVLESFAKKENKYQLLCANCNWIKRYENKEVRTFEI